MAVKLLDAVTSTGVSASFRINALVKSHTVQSTITGAPTAVTVDLEGSVDNVSFFQLASDPYQPGDLTAQGAMFHVADKPVKFIRVNLTALTGGTSPTVTAVYEGFERGS